MRFLLCSSSAQLLTLALLVFAGCSREHKEASTVQGTAKIATVEQSRARSNGAGSTRQIAQSHNAPSDEVTSQPTLLVTGKTMGPDGQPLPNCSLTLVQMQSAGEMTTYAQCLSDASGDYRLTAPIIQNPFLLADAAGHVRTYSYLRTAESAITTSRTGHYRPVRIQQDFRLPFSGSISGKVINEKGEPVPGASVRAYTAERFAQQQVWSPTSTTLTATGEFSIQQVPHGKTNLTVTANGLVPNSLVCDVPVQGLVVSLQSGGAIVSGRVLDAATSQPLAQATLELRSPWRPDVFYDTVSTETDAAGTFRFEHLPATTFELNAHKDHLALLPSTRPASYEFGLAANERREGIELALYPGHRIHGLAREKDTTTPIARVSISVSANSEPITTSTAGDGSFDLMGVFASDAGRAMLTVTKPGFRVTGLSSDLGALAVTLPPDKWDIEQDIELVRNMTISGTVRDQDGNPVPSASVSLLSSTFNIANEKPTPVNAGGHYEMEVAPDTTIRVKAEAAGYGPAYSKSVAIAKAGVSDIDITLNAAATVEGLVVDAVDHPVAHATVSALTMVSVNSEGGGISHIDRSKPALSDDDGKFVLHDLQPEDTNISALQDGHPQSRTVKLSLHPGEWKSGVKLVFERPHFLAGRVSMSDASPVSNAEIDASPSDDEWANRTQTKTDANGDYRLDELPAKQVSLRITDETRRLQKFVEKVQADRDHVDFVMDDDYSLTLVGHVVDPEGQPVENFAVTSSGEIKPRKDTAHTGTFTARMKDSEQTFTIETRQYAKLTKTVRAPTGASRFEYTFHLCSPGSLAGRVVEKGSGKPMANVLVYVAAGDELWNRIESKAKVRTTTAADGAFRFENLDAGRLTIMISPAPPVPQVPQHADVPSGQNADMGNIEVGTGGSIRGIVQNASTHQPVPNVPLELICMSRTQANTTSAPDGTFSFDALAASSYAVKAPQQGVGTFVTISPDEIREITLPIGFGKLVAHILENGQPVSGASISAMSTTAVQNFRANGEQSGAGGTIIMDNLVPGRWQLYVSRGGGAGGTTEYADVDADKTTEVTINLPTGRVSGTVVDSSGNPVSSAAVALAHSDTGAYSSPRNTTTDSDGAFSFSSLRPDTYSLTAVRQEQGSAFVGGIAVTADAPNPAPLRLRLEKQSGGELVSTALQLDTGQPVPEAWCKVSSAKGEYLHGQVRDDRGTVHIKNIPSGTYRVCVGYYGFSQLCHTVEIKDGEAASLQDVLSKSGSLAWMITSASGKPLGGVHCKLVHSDIPEANQEGTTTQQGLWYAIALAPGHYEASALPPAGAPVSFSLDVAAGQSLARTSATSVP